MERSRKPNHSLKKKKAPKEFDIEAYQTRSSSLGDEYDQNLPHDYQESIHSVSYSFQFIVRDKTNNLIAERKALELGIGVKTINDYKHRPRQVTIKEAAKVLNGKKHIVILCGKGVSNLPEIRNQKEHWQEYEEVNLLDPKQILTSRYFHKYPESIWHMFYDLLDKYRYQQPNSTNKAINVQLLATKFFQNLLEFCAQHRDLKIKASVLNENIDDIQSQMTKKSELQIRQLLQTPEKFKIWKSFVFTPNIYELQGNFKYMHCTNYSKPCSYEFHLIPNLRKDQDRATTVQSCKQCGFVMKPHVLFHDYLQDDIYYRHDTVLNLVNKCDCMIVVGSDAESKLAKKFLYRVLDKEHIPIIEINETSQINKGNNLQLIGKIEYTLEQLINEYFNIVKSDESLYITQPQEEIIEDVKPPVKLQKSQIKFVKKDIEIKQKTNKQNEKTCWKYSQQGVRNDETKGNL